MSRPALKPRQQAANRKPEAAFSRLSRRRGNGAAGGHASLSENAYRKIRLAIQDGTIEPGAHLTEAGLSAWLQMSRTPIREAMHRLESEGLLLNQPFRGAIVVTLGEDDIRDLFEIRELLETAAAVRCAQNASAAEIAAMRALIEEERLHTDDPHLLIEINRRFHQAICEGAQNQFLRNALATIQSSIALLGKSNLLSGDRARAAHREHRSILSAIEKHDGAAAERAARRHVETSLNERLKRHVGR